MAPSSKSNAEKATENYDHSRVYLPPSMPNAEFAYLTIIQYFKIRIHRKVWPQRVNPPPPNMPIAHRRLDGSGSAAHKNKQSHLESDADPQLSTIIRMQNVSYGQVCCITTLGKCSASNYSVDVYILLSVPPLMAGPICLGSANICAKDMSSAIAGTGV